MSVSHAGQMSLRLKLRDEAGFENFLEARNAQAVARIREWLEAPAPEPLLICGDAGSGKSHLLNAACLSRESAGSGGLYLSLHEAASFSPEAIEGFEAFDLICLDELEALPSTHDWQEALLHLYNRVLDSGGHLLLASRSPPAGQEWVLPDLASRLRAVPVVQLARPRDAELHAMLRARASGRGLDMPDEVAAYILKRARRDTGVLVGILERLDEASLQHQRRLTVPFVKHILGW